MAEVNVSKLIAGHEAKKAPKKVYGNLKIEVDTVVAFKKASKALGVTQTELLKHMLTTLHAQAEAEYKKRGLI